MKRFACVMFCIACTFAGMTNEAQANGWKIFQRPARVTTCVVPATTVSTTQCPTPATVEPASARPGYTYKTITVNEPYTYTENVPVTVTKLVTKKLADGTTVTEAVNETVMQSVTKTGTRAVTRTVEVVEAGNSGNPVGPIDETLQRKLSTIEDQLKTLEKALGAKDQINDNEINKKIIKETQDKIAKKFKELLDSMK